MAGVAVMRVGVVLGIVVCGVVSTLGDVNLKKAPGRLEGVVGTPTLSIVGFKEGSAEGAQSLSSFSVYSSLFKLAV
jgi:hypothetical protein